MIGWKGFTSRKSFRCSDSQTLFFGGREATTGNTSAVRRLLTWESARLLSGRTFDLRLVLEDASLGGEITLLALYPSSLHIS